MRNQHMGGVAAVGGNSEMTMRRAEVFLAGAAGGAGAAANPGVDRNAAADDLRVGRLCPRLSITPAISWPSVNGSLRPALTSSLLSSPSAK